MSKTKKTTLIAIFVVFILPGLVMIYMNMLFNINFSHNAQGEAFVLAIMGLWLEFFAGMALE